MKKIVTISLILFLCNLNILAQLNRINVNGQSLFLSGMNMAWGTFANDAVNPDLAIFDTALSQISEAGGNTMRWWVHVNGLSSPIFTDGLVSGLQDEVININAILDLAYSKGMLICLSLWSHDMLSNGGQNLDNIQSMLADSAAARAYIDNALIPLVRGLKDHPAIACWEIFNEPEGMLPGGWTNRTTTYPAIKRFVNWCAGAIHREAPNALVTNGTHRILYNSDFGSFVNNYSDSSLIASGGDSLGTLNFYQVHYYDNFGTAQSPFLNPFSHWELDKPLVIGEFAANGVNGLNAFQMYSYLYDNLYAGGWSWTWTGHDGFGNVDDAAPGMTFLRNSYPDAILILTDSSFNYSPTIAQRIPDLKVFTGTNDTSDYIDLKSVFRDKEDSTNLTFSIESNSNPDLVSVAIDETDKLDFTFTPEMLGNALIRIKAVDSGSKSMLARFNVNVITPDALNLALLQNVTSSSIESATYDNVNAVDGDLQTRWSSAYNNNQWIAIHFTELKEISSVELIWEAAFGRVYDIQVSQDSLDWTTVYSEVNGNGGTDIINFNKTSAKHIRMFGIQRGTQWGYSLFEFRVFENAINDIKDNFIIADYSLSQNYPNPFNPTTKIIFAIQKPGNVTLKVYDLLGQEVATLVDEFKTVGKYDIQFDASRLASGAYIYSIVSGEFSESKKMMVLK